MELHGCKGSKSAVVAMISRRPPGRAWLVAHCPKAIGAVEAAERHPVIASASARNF